MKQKPYFAEYIPVEGEIKVGDIVLEQLTTGDIEPFEIHHENDIDLNNQKKAKLFLCSRDIQVDDTVYLHKEELLLHQDKTEVWVQPADELKVLSIKNKTVTVCIKKLHDTGTSGGQFAPEELFKIIGEISPDALSYVKRGDEFDENEWRGPIINREQFKARYYIQIIGPCGHFH
jgi:hypothetical protein